MRDVVQRNYAFTRDKTLVGFLFAVVQDVQRNSDKIARFVRFSWFLFAVVRDVQRNSRGGRVFPQATGFHSLSCETYSGTNKRLTFVESVLVSIRCRARRTAEPHATRRKRRMRFLFAVVRDVQRNRTVRPSCTGPS